MKHYMYLIIKESKRRTGGFRKTAWVYRIKRNIPEYVTEARWTTGASCGGRSEVMNALIRVGELPQKFYGLYREHDQSHFRIYALGYY